MSVPDLSVPDLSVPDLSVLALGVPVLSVEVQTWPIEGEFKISRGAKREAVVVVATVSAGSISGRGECVPYARYGETTQSVGAALEAMAGAIAEGLSRDDLRARMPAGAARNALDCALWDFAAKRDGRRAWAMAGLAPPQPLTTAYTLSLGPPEEMAARAQWAARFPLLKLKLAGEGDAARMRAVRHARPDARLVVDGNEAFEASALPELLAVAAALGVELIEQPLPAGQDDALAMIERIVPVCADESVHLGADMAALAGRYDAVNIKLDKTGGLTEALATMASARAAGLRIMVGCMVGTSLGMAPAFLLAQEAEWVDLDGPLLLANDRLEGLRYRDAVVEPPEPALWG